MKELIYFRTSDLKPEGGPAGYLFNLEKELKKQSIKWIDFVKTEEQHGALKNLFCHLPAPIQKIAKMTKRYLHRNDFLNVLSDTPKMGFADLDGYDIVHFHSTLTMYKAKDALKNYHGIVILTSHSPKILSKEIAEDCVSKKDYKKHKKSYDKLSVIDDYSFSRADKIMFPCKEAEEPYYHTWEKYKKIHDRYKSKYVYIPTGISPISTASFSREKIRNKYKIPNDAFVVSYVGRHLPVKGYDQLKEIAKNCFSVEEKNIYFLIAGKEKPMTGLKHKHWIEAGWVNNPDELIFASDVFILPNKETYFDLALLQAMSIGKPIILTSTGGNKHFRKYDDSGLLFYDYGDNKKAANTILQLSAYSKDRLNDLGIANKAIFTNNYTIDKFTNRYIVEMQKIAKRRKQ